MHPTPENQLPGRRALVREAADCEEPRIHLAAGVSETLSRPLPRLSAPSRCFLGPLSSRAERPDLCNHTRG